MTALAHRIDGDGEPVLLLNGGLMTMTAWDPVVTRLTASHRVIRCDFRGQLMSLPLGPPPATMAGHAEDVKALLDATGVQKTHVVGTSLGALAGIVLAANHPDRVQSLVAMTATDVVLPEAQAQLPVLRDAVSAAAAGGDGRRVLEIMAPYTFSPRWLSANRDVFDARRTQISLLPPQWYEGLGTILASLEHVDLRPALPRITAPTLVVGAECDRLFPVVRSQALVEGIRNSILHIVPGAAHGWVAEDPAGVVDTILPFLLKHSMKGPL
jgi:pimeloyl-ACP methyl ester carboxylesterase